VDLKELRRMDKAEQVKLAHASGGLALLTVGRCRLPHQTRIESAWN